MTDSVASCTIVVYLAPPFPIVVDASGGHGIRRARWIGGRCSYRLAGVRDCADCFLALRWYCS